MSHDAPAMLHILDAEDAHKTMIFDVMNDPRKRPEEIESFVSADPSCLGAIDGNSQTPLHEAARRGSSRLIRFFVRHGANLEVKGDAGETPLLLACDSGSLYAVHALVECGADVTAVDVKGKNAMHYAASIGAIHIMHYLGETQNVSYKSADYEGNTPLHFAVLKKRVDTIKYLFRKKRANRAASNKTGTTPLHLAVKHISGPMVTLFLRASNSRKLLMIKDGNGCTPFELAELGGTSKHKILAQKMDNWYSSPEHMRKLPWFTWTLFALLPAIALILSPLLFGYFRQPLGFILALVMAISGLFIPMTFHRLPHDDGWQNPTPMAGLVFGVMATTLCYFCMVFPRLFPSNMVVFIFLTINSFTALYLFFKLKTMNPGLDKVGKIGRDGNPLTILDVAKQGSSSDGQEKVQETHSSPDSYAFCTYCEIVIPDRTKHCKLCSACCNGFDHHCVWLTKCIGYNNHRMFVTFTLLLALDNFLFLYESVKLLSILTMSTNVITLIEEGFSSEHWIFILIICNCVALFFALMNFIGQLINISKLETTYFDMSGKASYKAPRERKKFTLAMRLRLIYLFFTDYKKWYNRPKHDVTSACYPKYTV